MLTKILFSIGSILMATFIIMIACGNQNGWSYSLPSVVILGLSALPHGLAQGRGKKAQKQPEQRKRRRIVEEWE